LIGRLPESQKSYIKLLYILEDHKEWRMIHTNEQIFFQRLHAEVNDVIRKQIENIQLYISVSKGDQMDYTFWKVILQV
jgi:competence protein ComGF